MSDLSVLSKRLLAIKEEIDNNPDRVGRRKLLKEMEEVVKRIKTTVDEILSTTTKAQLAALDPVRK